MAWLRALECSQVSSDHMGSVQKAVQGSARHDPGVDAAVAITAGLAGGSLGALITTLLRISHEREEQLRERMITAADDFGTGILQAIIDLRDEHGR